MIRNYCRIAWRNIIRNKVFSIINILGLALGMTCSLLIALWIMDERNMDTFHENDEQLYSVFERQYHDGIIEGGHYTPGILAEEMKIKFPEVEFATSMISWDIGLSSFQMNEKLTKKNGNFGSPDFFTMFSYKIIAGDAKTPLDLPNNIAISRQMAVELFTSPESAIGKSLRYDDKKDVQVSAVFEDVPNKSSKKFDFILPWEVFLEENSWARDWTNNGPSTILSLRKGTDVEAFRSKIKSFIDLYAKQENFRIELDVQRYSDMYLYSNFKNGEVSGGRIQYVVLFSIVAGFILLIACINFMNLSTAKSMRRAKEIGIRKVIGAVRSALIRQFIGEALLMVLLSSTLALITVYVLLPAFNTITNKYVEIPFLSLSFWLSMGALILVTGFISGSYPAFFLSSFQPVQVLKGTMRSAKSTFLRKGLVVFQFALSTILIISTIVISRQINFVQSTNLGYNRSNLVFIPIEGALQQKYPAFKSHALTMPGIQAMTQITNAPTSITNGTGGVVWEGKDPSARTQFTFAATGYDFIRSMELELVVGRDFSPDFIDTASYIVNEAAVKIFGYTDPIGMPLTFWEKKGTIVGVIKDTHFNSLHDAIRPLVLRLGENIGYGTALVRIEGGKTKEALTSLEHLFKEINPQIPFSYQFADEEYQKLYKSEEIVGNLSVVFASLGVFISCLGLLGLAMFTAEQRTRELGIRKVLGATATSLFGLLSKELLLLVVVSMLVASPFAWWVMTNWLGGYAYRVDLTFDTFVLAGSIVFAIALATISFQALKASLINPVQSLKIE